MVGQCELKFAPDDVTPENLKLKILGYGIDITGVYQQEGINRLRGKAPLGHAVMPSWAS